MKPYPKLVAVVATVVALSFRGPMLNSQVAPSAPIPARNLPQILCDEQSDGFCDVRLAIEKASTTEDGTTLIAAAGVRGEKVLTLRIVVAAGMKRGDMNPATLAPHDYSLYQGGIRLERVDATSDRFLTLLSGFYHTKQHPVVMSERVSFAAFAFRGDPGKLDAKEVLFELYHDDPGSSVPQCELLLSVNLPMGEIVLREKSQDFRECAIRILAAGG